MLLTMSTYRTQIPSLLLSLTTVIWSMKRWFHNQPKNEYAS